MNWRTILFILSVTCSVGSALAVPATKALISKDQAIYSLGVHACSYKITAHKSSTGSVDEVGSTGFTVSRNSLDNGFSFRFSCSTSQAADYCESAWTREVLDADPGTLQRMKVKFYKKVNPLYRSVVIGSNTAAVNPPLPRSISFCFNTGNKVVEGWANIGDEYRNRAPEALQILKSLRIN